MALSLIRNIIRKEESKKVGSAQVSIIGRKSTEARRLMIQPGMDTTQATTPVVIGPFFSSTWEKTNWLPMSTNLIVAGSAQMHHSRGVSLGSISYFVKQPSGDGTYIASKRSTSLRETFQCYQRMIACELVR